MFASHLQIFNAPTGDLSFPALTSFLKNRAGNEGPQASYNGWILGKKSEIRPNALFWSEFGGIFKSLEKFGEI